MASDDGLTRGELAQLVMDLRHDLDLLNQIMNTQATAFGWCDEYEERIEKYNAEFRAFVFQRRAAKGVQITARNAFAARRLATGHLISTLQKYGIEPPDWGYGVVRDHRKLDKAHQQLVERIGN